MQLVPVEKAIDAYEQALSSVRSFQLTFGPPLSLIISSRVPSPILVYDAGTKIA